VWILEIGSPPTSSSSVFFFFLFLLLSFPPADGTNKRNDISHPLSFHSFLIPLLSLYIKLKLTQVVTDIKERYQQINQCKKYM